MAEFLNVRRSHIATLKWLTLCPGRDKERFLKFFNLSTRAPSRGEVVWESSFYLGSYDVLNILNYLKLYITKQQVSLSRAPLGNFLDLEEFARHPGGRGGKPVFAPYFTMMIASDTAAFGPAALSPLHANPWRMT